jgi:polar amino acid transport system permease protein
VWHWQDFFGYLISAYILGGVLTTLWLTLAGMAGGLVLGSVLALSRRSRRRPWRMLAAFYVWLFRGTPLLVQLLVIYTCLPLAGLRLSVIESALLGLVLNEAAYLAEIIRAGLDAVPRGQVDAAQAIGLRPWLALRLVVAPQALRVVIPPLGNSVNGLLKTTSITSVISMEELLRRTQLLIADRFEVLELFAVAAIYYLLLTSAWELVQRRLERRFGRGTTMAGEAR